MTSSIKPIIVSAHDVRALLDGRMTRRVALSFSVHKTNIDALLADRRAA